MRTTPTRSACSVLAAMLAVAMALPAVAETKALDLTGLRSIELYPDTISLSSARAQSQLVVTGYFENGQARDLTRAAQFRIDDASVATIDDTRVVPQSNGSAMLEARVGNLHASTPITVAGADLPDLIRFEGEVLPILTKQGCNAGSCHGSPQGKAGFSLSLLAYAPEKDAEALTRDGLARRTLPIAPDESLLLKKPLLRMPHVGGKRIHKGDLAHRILRQWIAEGARAKPEAEPDCTGITVYPHPARELRLPYADQQLSVLATFADGEVRDVTSIATYDVSDKQVLSCDDRGLVRGASRGSAAVMVRYLNHVESIYFTVVEDIPNFVWKDSPEHNYVDRLVNARLRQLQYLPSELCDDNTFVRRVHLDLTGLLPSVERTRAFLADASPDKRARLIDELLDSEEFARFWALKDADLMRVNHVVLTDGRAELFADWLRESWRSNQPFDQFARELLTASGDTTKCAPANYFFAIPTNEEVTETTAQLFMGSRINCAKCHNHPFENWTQDDYYRIAAVFVRTKNEKGTIVVADKGEAMNPSTGVAMPPWGAEKVEHSEPAPSDRREVFVEWLTEAGNPYFARVEVNRIWSHLMGRGIVEPVDDFRSSNPPSNPELLDALATDFEASGYDRRYIIRLICNSHTYQRSSTTNEFNRDDISQFSHYRPRRLSAEQLQDAIGFATTALKHTSTIADELADARKRAEELERQLPGERDAWEAAVKEKLDSLPAWSTVWQFAGPLSAKTFEEALATVYPPETEAELTFEAFADGDKKAQWKRRTDWPDSKVNLTIDTAPGPYFLGRKVYASRPGKAAFAFGANGAMKIWVNGAVVFERTENKGVEGADEKLEVDLVAGENAILVKIVNGGGYFSFYSDFISFDGEPAVEPDKDDTPIDELAILLGILQRKVTLLGMPMEAAELVMIPQSKRTAAHQKRLNELQEEMHPELPQLRERVKRLTYWLDYQTQRPYPELSDFLQAFGQPKRESPCACDRSNEPTIDQALQTLNGDLVRESTAKAAEHYSKIEDNRAMLDELYLAAFCRTPTEREIATATSYLKSAPDRKAAIQDLVWALVNTREFMFQH